MSSTGATPDALPETVQMFLTHLDIEKGSSTATLASYRRDLIQFEEYLCSRSLTLGRLEKVDREVVRGFLAYLHGKRMAKTSVSRKLSSLRSFFKYMIKMGFCTGNPMNGIRNPKQETRHPRALNVDQVSGLLDASADLTPQDRRDLALAEVLYGSGLRVSEAIGLDIDDADISSGILRISGKGGKERLAPLSDSSAKALDAYIRVRGEFNSDPADNAMFFGNRGKRINRRQVNRILERMAADAKLQGRVHPHMLRHSFASHMLQSGADMRSVQELLGHERLTTTQRYTHLNLQQIMNVYDRAHPLSGVQAPPAGDEEDV